MGAGADARPERAAGDGHANVRKAVDAHGRWPPRGGAGAPRDRHGRTLPTPSSPSASPCSSPLEEKSVTAAMGAFGGEALGMSGAAAM